MALLIDGYNLLHVTGIVGSGIGPGSLHRSRQALLNFLAASIDGRELKGAVIVFDATDAPPGRPDTVEHQGLTVRYARGYADADALLEELISQHHTPRRLTVVSSDHRVQRAARRRRAKAVDSDHWYGELLAKRRNRSKPPSDVSQKPEGVLDPNEVAYWLEKFAALPDRPAERQPPSHIDNPFPPGYAEDLLEE